MTCLSCWVLGSTWLSPPKRFFGVFPKQFCPHGRWTLIPLVSQFPAVFWANGCCFRKGSGQGSADHSSHLSPTDDASFKFFEGSANCALHLSPSLFLGSKLLTCLTHANPVRRNHPSCRCCWGILWTYFTKSGGRYLQKNQRLSPFGNIFH